MAYVSVTPGVGKNISVETVGGVEIQHFKALDGTVGSSTPIPGDGVKGWATYAADAISAYRKIAVGTSGDAASVKATPGYLRGWSIYSARGTIAYVKLHNTAGTPTAGASVFYVIPVYPGLPNVYTLPGRGIAFSVGIGITAVTGMAEANADALTANDMLIQLHYE